MTFEEDQYKRDKLAHARKAAQDVITHESVDSAWMSGSLLAGLGTPTSDVDIFVMLKPGAVPDQGMRQIFGDGQRVDLEFYEVETIQRVVDTVAAFELTHRTMAPVWVPEDELDVAIRLTYADPLKQSDTLSRLQDQLHSNQTKLRQLLLARWAVEANNHLEDFEGAYLGGDFPSTALVGQSLMLVAGKALAAAAGDIYFGRKWTYHQLRRSAGSTFPIEEFIRFQLGRWDERGMERGYEEFTAFLQTCLTAAQTLGWNSVADLSRWPHWTRDSAGPVRHPSYNAIRLTDGVELNWELHRQLIVKPDVALLWGLCNGQSEDAIVEAARSLADASDDLAGLTTERARHILAALDKNKLLAPTPGSSMEVARTDGSTR
jgi:predicted nucleotidyltransferase/nitrogen fixation-related uncharacterized protein